MKPVRLILFFRLMLPYEQHVKGGNQQLSKPKDQPSAPASAPVASIRKPVRGKVQSALRKNGVTSQVNPLLRNNNSAALIKKGFAQIQITLMETFDF